MEKQGVSIMPRAAVEHFEMAARAFTSAGKVIDPDVLEKFANILAQESAGRSAVVKELSDLKRAPGVLLWRAGGPTRIH